ncbi:MAG: hypothetical protein QME66_08335 [Candidatus Eisenbacteria bacterium]|nr:hypothetical protein [Candidatus Eisenbacteria bacterium]
MDEIVASPPAPLFVPEKAIGLRHDFLVLFHRGMQYKTIASKYAHLGLDLEHIINAIQTASDADHVKARKTAELLPRLKDDRIRGAGLTAVETLIEVCEEGDRDADRVRAAAELLDRGETKEKKQQDVPLCPLTPDNIKAFNEAFQSLHEVIDAVAEPQYELPAGSKV